ARHRPDFLAHALAGCGKERIEEVVGAQPRLAHDRSDRRVAAEASWAVTEIEASATGAHPGVSGLDCHTASFNSQWPWPYPYPCRCSYLYPVTVTDGLRSRPRITVTDLGHVATRALKCSTSASTRSFTVYFDGITVVWMPSCCAASAVTGPMDATTV